MNETIHAIIIDDEAPARDIITNLLSVHQNVKIVATASDAERGMEMINQYKPDLVFLDINMPGKTGLEMMAELRKLNVDTSVIFITAYDEFALRAFKVSAFDYLLKPVDPDALNETIERFSQNRAGDNLITKIDHLMSQMRDHQKVRISTRSGFFLIDPAEIMYAQADGNYSLIYYTSVITETISLNLGAIFDMMPPGRFTRISRSVFVNTSLIYSVDRKKRLCEIRKDGERIQLKGSSDHLKEIR